MASSFFGRFFAPRAKTRVSGQPTSSNGASSFHLFWDVPPEPLRSVAVTLTVLEPPLTPDLFFWALQMSFLEDGQRTGAGHLGLQHHPRYPGSTAANWGGYGRNGQELGGELFLPSSLNNPNTCDFEWRPGTPYRLRVEPSPVTGWRGSITDLSTNSEVVLRDLEGSGDALGAPMVWSEVFADCDASSTAIRWSDPTVETMSGYLIQVTSARVNYQSEANGGCSNTTVLEGDTGVVQRTAAQRLVWPDATVSF
ncbi:MAG: hypothetical protein ACN4GZ_00375 [Acidimicrobiales bacterium]